MKIYQKPALTAAERQTALEVIPTLKSILPEEFHDYLDQVATTIKAKPSVPEQNLEIERQKAEAAIKQGWEKIQQGRDNLALAQKRLEKRDYPGAMQVLKLFSQQISQIRNEIRQIDTVLGKQVNDFYGRRVYAIQGPERDRLYQQRNQLDQELQGLQARYDEMVRSVLFGQPRAPQPQPKPQPQAQPKQQQQQPKQQQKPPAQQVPKQGTLPSGRKFVIE